jgi:protoporphyrinogen oxidase
LKVAIIGAGPAGMTAAYELAKKGVKVEVFEAADYVGGMARTITLWNQKVDIGPHRFFSSDPRINKLWLELVNDDYDVVSRLTRILYKGRLFYYPLKPFNALSNLGIIEACRCMWSYGLERLHPVKLDDQPSFEQWVVSRFGRRLFGIFFKTYSEKLWGISCDDLDADFAAQRIKKFSLGEAVKAAFLGSGKKHKTLVDQFCYPHGGSGVVYERMAERCREMGGSVLLKTPVRRVLVDDGRIVGLELEDGNKKHYDHVVSTFPITRLVGQMEAVPEPVRKALLQLKFRNTILVFLRVARENLFPDNWLYVHSENLQTGRITNFRNWTPHLYGNENDSILAMEYWCYHEDALWGMSDEGLVELASREVRLSGLVGKPGDYADIKGGHVERVARSYPVYAKGYQKPLKVVVDFLRTFRGLLVIGRYGAFKYNNQDHSILMGLLAAENIANGAGHDLWQINTDYEYQESHEAIDQEMT